MVADIGKFLRAAHRGRLRQALQANVDVSGRVDVHEHRAPTDDSVRLLAEMENAAHKRIIGRLHLANCRIDAEVIAERLPYMDQLQLTARATINGRDVVATYCAPAPEMLGGNVQGLEHLQKLRDEFAAELAAVILAPAWPKLLGNITAYGKA